MSTSAVRVKWRCSGRGSGGKEQRREKEKNKVTRQSKNRNNRRAPAASLGVSFAWFFAHAPRCLCSYTVRALVLRGERASAAFGGEGGNRGAAPLGKECLFWARVSNFRPACASCQGQARFAHAASLRRLSAGVGMPLSCALAWEAAEGKEGRCEGEGWARERFVMIKAVVFCCFCFGRGDLRRGGG